MLMAAALGGSLIGESFPAQPTGCLSRCPSPFTDATTGCKMFRRSDFERFDGKPSYRWAFAFEMAIKAQHLGLKPGEVPLLALIGSSVPSSFQLVMVDRIPALFLWGLRRAFANGFWRRARSGSAYQLSISLTACRNPGPARMKGLEIRICHA